VKSCEILGLYCRLQRYLFIVGAQLSWGPKHHFNNGGEVKSIREMEVLLRQLMGLSSGLLVNQIDHTE